MSSLILIYVHNMYVYFKHVNWWSIWILFLRNKVLIIQYGPYFLPEKLYDHPDALPSPNHWKYFMKRLFCRDNPFCLCIFRGLATLRMRRGFFCGILRTNSFLCVGPNCVWFGQPSNDHIWANSPFSGWLLDLRDDICCVKVLAVACDF